jgi:DNA-binding response OmpR family regulator
MCRGRRILVVDDEPVIAKSLAAILSSHGYDVKYVLSAEDGLRAAEVWQPHLAVIDVILPKQNGIEMAIALTVNHPAIRILLFSGQAETAGLLDQARERGHDFQVLAKPAHPLVFLETISILLKKVG